MFVPIRSFFLSCTLLLSYIFQLHSALLFVTASENTGSNTDSDSFKAEAYPASLLDDLYEYPKYVLSTSHRLPIKPGNVDRFIRYVELNNNRLIRDAAGYGTHPSDDSVSVKDRYRISSFYRIRGINPELTYLANVFTTNTQSPIINTNTKIDKNGNKNENSDNLEQKQQLFCLIPQVDDYEDEEDEIEEGEHEQEHEKEQEQEQEEGDDTEKALLQAQNSKGKKQTPQSLAKNKQQSSPATTTTKDLQAGIKVLAELESGPCINYNSGWWVYELCYGKHIRQYHKPSEYDSPRIRNLGELEFFLGRYENRIELGLAPQIASPPLPPPPPPHTANQDKTTGSENQVIKELSKSRIQTVGKRRYISQVWSQGTLCDQTNRPRTVEVQYHCNPRGETHISQVSETSICQYLVVVQLPELCKVNAFYDKVVTDGLEIKCFPIVKNLTLFEAQKKRTKYQRLAASNMDADADADADTSESSTLDSESDFDFENRDNIINFVDKNKQKLSTKYSNPNLKSNSKSKSNSNLNLNPNSDAKLAEIVKELLGGNFPAGNNVRVISLDELKESNLKKKQRQRQDQAQNQDQNQDQMNPDKPESNVKNKDPTDFDVSTMTSEELLKKKKELEKLRQQQIDKLNELLGEYGDLVKGVKKETREKGELKVLGEKLEKEKLEAEEKLEREKAEKEKLEKEKLEKEKEESKIKKELEQLDPMVQLANYFFLPPTPPKKAQKPSNNNNDDDNDDDGKGGKKQEQQPELDINIHEILANDPMMAVADQFLQNFLDPQGVRKANTDKKEEEEKKKVSGGKKSENRISDNRKVKKLSLQDYELLKNIPDPENPHIDMNMHQDILVAGNTGFNNPNAIDALGVGESDQQMEQLLGKKPEPKAEVKDTKGSGKAGGGGVDGDGDGDGEDEDEDEGEDDEREREHDEL